MEQIMDLAEVLTTILKYHREKCNEIECNGSKDTMNMLSILNG